MFAGQPVIRHNVWVEVPNLDTDRDGVNDRIRVQISRPDATDRGTKLPIILVASPYSGGTHAVSAARHQRSAVRAGRKPTAHAGARPLPPHGTNQPSARQRAADPRPRGGGYQSYFLPRGFIFADANSLGTGHSTGCPTIGGVEENLAMKAVIDWFNGKGRAFDVDGKRGDGVLDDRRDGMIGTSYVGTLPIGAATLGVEGLKAIVPIAGVSSYYDHRRSYGTVINSFPMIGTDADTLFDNILSRKYPEACAPHARAHRARQGPADRRLQRVLGRAQLREGRRRSSRPRCSSRTA